jgi:C4-dicarboxylate-specific signal transduction histidine kinase
LGRQWTKGKSYYTLKPQNTLGYIGLTARENSQLEETTDREGFKDTAYYRNFYELLQSFVVFSGEAQGFLRRGWTQFRNKQAITEARVPEDTRPEQLAASIESEIKRGASLSNQVTLAARNFRSHIKSAESTAASQARPDDLAATVQDLNATLREAQELINTVEGHFASLSNLVSTARVLHQQIEALRRQLDDVYEVVGLGLTAEALSHEISNVATQLSQRTQQIQKYLKSSPTRDRRVVTYTEHVTTAVTELRRQLLFLAPSLRYVRERREHIDVPDFVRELFKHYTQHFQDKPINVDVKRRGQAEFHILISRGKLIQIVDNLFLNSEYWLIEDIHSGRLSRGTVTIEMDKPFIRVFDDGRGVDPTVETSLFEPFVTTKGRGKGRGLGLYIVRQLLAAEGCTIELLPKRNKFDRLFIFEVNLTGVLSDKH